MAVRDRRGELLGRPAAAVSRLHRAGRGADRRTRSARGHRSAPRSVRHPRPAALRLILAKNPDEVKFSSPGKGCGLPGNTAITEPRVYRAGPGTDCAEA